MSMVTGLGGVFIKAENPSSLAAWYQEVLGIDFGKNLYFSFGNVDEGGKCGQTALAFFPRDAGSPFRWGCVTGSGNS